MEEGWWGDADGEGVYRALPLFQHMMPSDQVLAQHNIVQRLFHIFHISSWCYADIVP